MSSADIVARQQQRSRLRRSAEDAEARSEQLARLAANSTPPTARAAKQKQDERARGIAEAARVAARSVHVRALEQELRGLSSVDAGMEARALKAVISRRIAVELELASIAVAVERDALERQRRNRERNAPLLAAAAVAYKQSLILTPPSARRTTEKYHGGLSAV